MNNQILDNEINKVQYILLEDNLKSIEAYALSRYLAERLQELSRRNIEYFKI